MVWKIILIVLAVLLLLVIALSLALMNFVERPKRPSMEECRTTAENEAKDKEAFRREWDSYTKEEVVIPSYDGYRLHGWLIRSSGDKYVIITHGYMSNRWGSVKYALMYLKMGYGVFLYDLRAFGENEKTYCSMGYREPRDLNAVIDEVRRRVGDFAELSLHGESLGAATTLMVLGLTKEKIRFAVADCPFSDVGMLFESAIKMLFHLPSKTAVLGSLATQVVHGYRFDRIKPIDTVRKTTVPILFIHGAEDDFIPPIHSKRMYDAAGGKKKLFLMPGAKHAMSYVTDPGTYQRVVAEFLDEL